MFTLWSIGGLLYKFSVFTVYFCTNLELRFSIKGYRNTQVVGKVYFTYIYSLATSMTSFETSLATLPMETNVAFCAHTSYIFLHTLHQSWVVAGPRKWFIPSKRTSNGSSAATLLSILWCC